MWTDPPYFGGGISDSAHTISESRNQVPRSTQNLKNSKKCDQINKVSWHDTLSEIVWAMSEIPPPNHVHMICAWRDFFETWNERKTRDSGLYEQLRTPDFRRSIANFAYIPVRPVAERSEQRIKSKKNLNCATNRFFFAQNARKPHAKRTQDARKTRH